MYVTNENARKEIARKRKQEKFRQWIERGLSEYDDLMSTQFKFELIIEKSGGDNELGI
jgi:hypothetical protein